MALSRVERAKATDRRHKGSISVLWISYKRQYDQTDRENRLRLNVAFDEMHCGTVRLVRGVSRVPEERICASFAAAIPRHETARPVTSRWHVPNL